MSSSPWPAASASAKRCAIARISGRSTSCAAAASPTSRASLAASVSANAGGNSPSSISLDFVRK